jgi:transposase
MDGVMEIITGRERRRRWSVTHKLRLVAEMDEPGATIRAVAARHGICESLLFTWRRQVREGTLAAVERSAFVPVQMLDAPPVSRPTETATPGRPARPAPRAASVAASGLIEIELGNGQQVRVGSDVNLAALRRVLAALRG